MAIFKCAGREFFAILEVEQIFADLALGELVGRLIEVIGQLVHGAGGRNSVFAC